MVTPLPMNITENITFPQLHWQMVMIVIDLEEGNVDLISNVNLKTRQKWVTQ